MSEYLLDMNATQAAIRAGYSSRTAYSIGQENLKKPEIQKAISEAMQAKHNELIADREARLSFWTEIMRDSDTDMKHRLRASELLGKACGDFTTQAMVQAEQQSSDYDLSKLTESELSTLRELLLKAC